MATLQQIANEAGVSIETVSRVVNGKLKENRPSSRRRADAIRRIATRLHYRPHAAARAMVQQRTRQIGLLIRNAADVPLVHLAAYETILGADSRLCEAGYVSCLVRLSDLPDGQRRSRVFTERVLDGVIALDELPEPSQAAVRDVAEHCVWVDSSVWQPQHCVRRDEMYAARLAIEQLAALGYRRCVWAERHMPATYEHFSAAKRREGARAAAAAMNLPLTPLLYRHDDPAALEQGLQLALVPSTAVVASDYLVARQVWDLMAAAGHVAGRDYALASCDSNSHTDAYWPALSRVSFDRYHMGVQAAAMMLAALGEGEGGTASQEFRGRWVPGATALRPVQTGGAETTMESTPRNRSKESTP